MANELIQGIVTVLLAIVGVAIIATLVGSNAQTGNVISSAGTAFANDLKAAEGPVSGGFGFTGQGGVSLPQIG